MQTERAKNGDKNPTGMLFYFLEDLWCTCDLWICWAKGHSYNICMHAQTCKHINTHVYLVHTYTPTHRHTHTHTHTQTRRHADTQTHRQTDKHTHNDIVCMFADRHTRYNTIRSISKSKIRFGLSSATRKRFSVRGLRPGHTLALFDLSVRLANAPL